MDQEVEVAALAEAPASDAPVTVADTPEVVTPVEVQPTEASKTFTQEELDAAIGKRLAREQRKWERERQVAPPLPLPADEPRFEQFNTPDEYAEAKAYHLAQKLVNDREVKRQQTEVTGAYHEREEDARVKYEDFDQVAYNPNLRITEAMAQTIQSSDIGPELAYHLGTNPKEAERISRLSPLVQARELGKLEAKLADAPPTPRRVSTAPAPFVPVTARGNGAPAYDTTDPRSIKTMSTSEWIEADRKRQAKKWEASNR